ncbi:hypothetical protein N7467_002262 [Penicillium canescens]|nr:hypothetical protein N7467_002262 [Penicillium canescens]
MVELTSATPPHPDRSAMAKVATHMLSRRTRKIFACSKRTAVLTWWTVFARQLGRGHIVSSTKWIGTISLAKVQL